MVEKTDVVTTEFEKAQMTMKKDYSDLSNLELLQLLAKEARELELLEYQGKVIDAGAVDNKAND